MMTITCVDHFCVLWQTSPRKKGEDRERVSERDKNTGEIAAHISVVCF